MSNSETDDSLGSVASAAGLPDITAIPLPAPVQRSLLRALGRLITGAVEVPIAYFETQAGKIRAHGKGTEAVTLAAAAAAAQRSVLIRLWLTAQSITSERRSLGNN
jgi:hypothetical protein